MRVHIFGSLPRQQEQIRWAMPEGVKVVFHESVGGGTGGLAVVWAAFLGHSEVAKLKRAIPAAAAVHERSVEAVATAARRVAGK